jgi:plastocyanin
MGHAHRFAALILLLGGCGGGGAATVSAPSEPSFSSLSISATTVSVAVGGTHQLQVNPKDQFGTALPASSVASFTSSDPAIATVNGTGLVTGLAPGTATITASMTIGGVTRTAACLVTVGLAPPAGSGNSVSTAGFAFGPQTITIAVNDSVTWHFVEAVHNVTFTGIAPAAGGVPDQQPGSRATRVFGTPGTYAYECSRHTGMQGQVVVQSGQAPVYSSLAMSPATPAIAVGGTVQLVATALDQNGSAMAGVPAATFASSAGSVASVNATGLVTGLTAGTVTITASLTATGVTHTATSTVTVTAPQPGSVTVTTPNQTFSPGAVTIAPGGVVTWQFSGSTHNVTFSGASPTGGNIPDTQPGNAVSRAFSTAGSYTYQCTRHSGMRGSVVVQGGPGGGVYTSLSLTPVAPVVSVGSNLQMTAIPLDQNGNPLVGLPAPGFISSDPATAAVAPSGVVSGTAPGTATITASLTHGGITHTATATVTVTQGQSGGVTIATAGNLFTPDDIDVPPGSTVTWQFSGTTHNVTFKTRTPAGGNIPDTAGSSVSRTFTVAGDYDYECTLHHNMKGRVRVQ